MRARLDASARKRHARRAQRGSVGSREGANDSGLRIVYRWDIRVGRARCRVLSGRSRDHIRRHFPPARGGHGHVAQSLLRTQHPLSCSSGLTDATRSSSQVGDVLNRSPPNPIRRDRPERVRHSPRRLEMRRHRSRAMRIPTADHETRCSGEQNEHTEDCHDDPCAAGVVTVGQNRRSGEAIEIGCEASVVLAHRSNAERDTDDHEHDTGGRPDRERDPTVRRHGSQAAFLWMSSERANSC